MNFTQFALLLSTMCLMVAATPIARTGDSLPKLADTLAVAKSPFEPITMAIPVSSAQTDELLRTTVGESSEGGKTTRAAQDEDGGESPASNESAGSTKTLASTAETTTESMESETGTTAAESDTETTVTTTTTTTQKPDMSTQAPVTTTTASESMEKGGASDPSTEAPATTITTLTTTTEAPTTTAQPAELSSTEAPKVEPNTSEPTRVAEVSTTEESSTEAVPQTTAAPSSTTDAPRESEASTLKEATDTSPASTTEAPSSATTTAAPTTTTAEPQASTSTSAPSTTAKPAAEPEIEKKNENEGKQCSHLPTYDSEEIQKVFREETTYKNGTIKGKFTYINFDQRYRLVHYTRLPYGPVKIDLVEELGKPESSGSSSASPLPASEIPNAVLQLRNILPNSLFGFPFMSSNQSPKPISEQPTRDGENNRYFYSTDSISTPNLLTPRVPVSLPPGHKKISTPVNQPATGTLEQLYNRENAAVSEQIASGQPRLSTDRIFRSYGGGELSVSSPLTPNRNTNYYHQSPILEHPSNKHSGLVYTHIPPPQYQYAPITVYPLQPPSYISSARSNYDSPSYDRRHDSVHQAHQPHSHEHFVAPFMYAQLPQNDQPIDASRLKLRVKSTKSLNVAPTGTKTGEKSAQLRMSSSVLSQQAHAGSPSQQVRRQNRQQRLGKQNHELKSAVNTSPVVYHVLRSPVGRMYSLPEYQNQEHSMAYDHDS